LFVGQVHRQKLSKIFKRYNFGDKGASIERGGRLCVPWTRKRNTTKEERMAEFHCDKKKRSRQGKTGELHDKGVWGSLDKGRGSIQD